MQWCVRERGALNEYADTYVEDQLMDEKEASQLYDDDGSAGMDAEEHFFP